jgi:hypothetical protein
MFTAAKNKIHNTNIENRRDNQEWAAVNIGYNTQNEEKQNTQHTHRKLTGQPGMVSCKHWIQYTERRQTKYKTQT